MTSSPAWVFGELHLPQPLRFDDVRAWLTHLSSAEPRSRLVLEVRADRRGVRYLLGADPWEVAAWRRTLPAGLPGASVTIGRGHDVRRRDVTAAGRLRLRPSSTPLDSSAPAALTRALLTVLTEPLRAGESLVVQTLFGPSRPPRRVARTVADPETSWWGLLLTGQRPATTDSRKYLTERLGQAGFAVAIRVGVASLDRQRRRRLLRALTGALATAQRPGVRLDVVAEGADKLNRASSPWRWPLHLSVSEIAALLGWPYHSGRDDAAGLPGLPPMHPRPLQAAANVHQGERVFAVSAVPGDQRRLGIAAADQTYHAIAYGPSGSGKTNALLHLILADVVAGRPVVVLDPKYQLVNDVLARLPQHRVADVVELNAADPSPIGFNPLDVTRRDPDVVVDGILAVFQAVFHDGWGPRTSDIFSAALRTLARTSTREHPVTLVDLPRLLTDPAFRRPFLGRVQDDVALAGFWSWYEQQPVAAQAAAIAAPMNKLRQFLLRPALTRMLDQPASPFRLRDVFRDNKIVLVPLNEGLIGPGTASLLGNLVIAEIWQATQERGQLARPQPATVYIDEAPRFLHLPVSLADALAVSRSLGVGWFLAAQFRQQFPPELRTAVDMNARSKIVFATEHDDARDMARLSPGLVPEDFMSLARYQAYVNLVAGGAPSGWALARTLPPPPTTTDPAAVRAVIRATYAPSPPPEEPPAQGAPPGESGPVGRKRRQRRSS